MIGGHAVEDLCGIPVGGPYQRIQMPVFDVVMMVQEAHHPAQVVTQRATLRTVWVGQLGQGGPSASQIAAKSRVHDPHHRGVRRSG
jgi:hypothetical protein